MNTRMVEIFPRAATKVPEVGISAAGLINTRPFIANVDSAYHTTLPKSEQCMQTPALSPVLGEVQQYKDEVVQDLTSLVKYETVINPQTNIGKSPLVEIHTPGIPLTDVNPTKKHTTPFRMLEHKVAMKKAGTETITVQEMIEGMIPAIEDPHLLTSTLNTKNENPFLSESVTGSIMETIEEKRNGKDIQTNLGNNELFSLKEKGREKGETSFSQVFSEYVFTVQAKEMGITSKLPAVELNIEKLDPEIKVDILHAERAAKALVKAGLPKEIVIETICKALRKTLIKKGKMDKLLRAIEVKKDKNTKKDAVMLIRDTTVAKARLSDAMQAFIASFFEVSGKPGEKVSGRLVTSKMAPIDSPELTSSAIRNGKIDGSNEAFRQDIQAVPEFGNMWDAFWFFMKKNIENSPVRFGKKVDSNRASTHEVQRVFKYSSKPSLQLAGI